jgi:LysM repeat protein
MNTQRLFLTLASFTMFWASPEHLFTVPTSSSNIQHTVSNLETELSYLKQKIENQESTIESLRAEVVQLVKATKELHAKSYETQESKIAKIEKNIEKILTDLKQFKAHSNELSDALGATQKSQTNQGQESKQHLEVMQEKVKNLEAALKSLTKAMQVKAMNVKISPTQDADASTSSSYRVKPGDSLAKIAKELKTSARELKELNGLQSDKIAVGQDLLIPPAKNPK